MAASSSVPVRAKVEQSCEFELFFRLSRYFEDISGVVHYGEPNSFRTRLKRTFFWISYFHNIFGLVLEVAYFRQALDRNASFVHIMALIPLIGHSLLAIAKLTVYVRNKEQLDDILVQLEEIHPKKMSADMAKDYKRKILYTKAFAAFYIGTLLAFNALPFMPVVKKLLQTGVFERKLPFYAWYWYDWDKPVAYEVTFLEQIWASIAAVAAILMTDVTLWSIVSLLSIQFDLLSGRFGAVNGSDEELLELMKLHLKLIELCKRTERIHSPALLCSFLLSSVIICLTGFQTVAGESIDEMIRFCTFMFVHLVHTFLLCYFGNMLMEKSAEVFNNVYQAPWYSAGIEFRKSTLMILLRGRAIEKLTAMKFITVSMPCFMSIISTSFSYFTLLQAVHNSDR